MSINMNKVVLNKQEYYIKCIQLWYYVLGTRQFIYHFKLFYWVIESLKVTKSIHIMLFNLIYHIASDKPGRFGYTLSTLALFKTLKLSLQFDTVNSL